MAEATKTYTFTALTPAVASEVNQNFNDVLGFLNGSVVHLDGSKPMTGGLVLPDTNPTSDNQATRKKYVDDRPRGQVAYAQRTTNMGVIGSTVVPGLHVNLGASAAAHRKLVTTVYIPTIDGVGGAAVFFVRIRAAASGTTLNRWNTLLQGTLDGKSAFLQYRETTGATPNGLSRDVAVEITAGGTTIWGTSQRPMFIAIDDLGPA